ncbi:MAG: phosphoribosylamine--glycine ligase [Gammaproteobacteria bacterium]
MRVLIVGGGGREHALAWKVASSAQVDRVYVAPGNAGTAREPKVENVAIPAGDLAALLAFAQSARIDLTLVGSEAPLVAGIVDRFEEAGLRCFGPSRSAAALEGSKVYAKSFMDRHGIATAPYASFSDLQAASAYIRAQALPLVIKANGLAAGKGVIIAHTAEEAIRAASDMLAGHAFGNAGQEIVVEGFLEGEEASFIVVSDGVDVLPLASAQDHKARDAGDRGPNTGGMGAYSPAPVLTQAVSDRALSEILLPTIRGMAREGRPYRGFLYVGVMVAPDGTPRVLEYNCRLGDPEAEVILFRLRSDLIEIIEAGLAGRLKKIQPHWDQCAALGVVLAAAGYPGPPRVGDVIVGLDVEHPADTTVFHSGTAIKEGRMVTAGGRVVCVCARGATVGEAQSLAYSRIKKIQWQGMYYRPDIGYRAVARETREADL